VKNVIGGVYYIDLVKNVIGGVYYVGEISVKLSLNPILGTTCMRGV